MTIIPESVPQVKNIFDAPPTCSSYELLSLWQRAVETRNSRLGNAVRAAANIRAPGLHPASLALLVDSHAAAATGLSYAQWVDELGGTRPAEILLVEAELFPRQWYDPTDDPPANAGTALASLPAATLVTRRELAELLHVCERTITRRIETHELPEPHKRGRESYWLAGELQEVTP